MPLTEAAILERIIETKEGQLTPEAARFLLSLDLRPTDRQHMEALAARGREGTLTAIEQTELQHYRQVAELLDRMRSKARQALTGQASTDSSPEPSPRSFEIPPGIHRSQQAFWQDLPELLRNRRDHAKWVVYHGDVRIGIAKDDADLIRECLRRGLRGDEYYITVIEPRKLPPWEPEEVEPIGSHHFDHDLPAWVRRK